MTRDISELWDFDLDGCHVAMTKERDYTWDGRPYYNNGICLMDLRRMREDGVDDLMIQELNKTAYKYVGQDVMQLYLKIKDLPSTYNACKSRILFLIQQSFITQIGVTGAICRKSCDIGNQGVSPPLPLMI